MTQLLGCRQPLYTRGGLLFGCCIGCHVYSADGFYVGCFREPLDEHEPPELYSGNGEYLGEFDPADDERLAVNTSKLNLRRRRIPELPSLPMAAITLYALREPLPARDGWRDFPPPESFAHPDHGHSLSASAYRAHDTLHEPPSAKPTVAARRQ